MYSERFKVYKADVVNTFLEKRNAAAESWLVELNRRKLRSRSIELIESGVDPLDHRALSDYLKMKNGDRDYLAAINATDADDFQGLFQFLNNPSRNPAASTVEFLSWLIDFKYRPHGEYIRKHEKGGKNGESVSILEAQDQGKLNGGPEESLSPEGNDQIEKPIILKERPGIDNADKNKWKEDSKGDSNLWKYGVGVVLVLAVLIWFFWPKKDCMYWSDDRYVACNCGTPKLDTPLVSLDRVKLQSFRRIKKIDTISAYAVDRYWYYRFPGTDSIEIYTARGVNPMHTDKELKKVKDYIVNTIHDRGRRN